MREKTKPNVLILNLKREYWEHIRDGEKVEEFRLIKPYWEKRLRGAVNKVFSFDEVHFKLGYPERDDESRILKRKWAGVYVRPVIHKEFGAGPIPCFCIRVGKEIKS